MDFEPIGYDLEWGLTKDYSFQVW